MPPKMKPIFAHRPAPLPMVSPVAKLHAEGVAPLPERVTQRDEFPSGDLWERFFELFEQMQNGISGLTEQLWGAIPSYIFEFAYLASGSLVTSSDASTTGSFPTLSARTSELEYITTVVATVPSGCTGLIQLGSANVPIGVGITVMPDVRFPLFPSDIRSLTISGGTGPVGLYLFGQVAPTRGKMPL